MLKCHFWTSFSRFLECLSSSNLVEFEKKGTFKNLLPSTGNNESRKKISKGNTLAGAGMKLLWVAGGRKPGGTKVDVLTPPPALNPLLN